MNECMTGSEVYCNDEWLFLNKCPVSACLALLKKKKLYTKNVIGIISCFFFSRFESFRTVRHFFTQSSSLEWLAIFLTLRVQDHCLCTKGCDRPKCNVKIFFIFAHHGDNNPPSPPPKKKKKEGEASAMCCIKVVKNTCDFIKGQIWGLGIYLTLLTATFCVFSVIGGGGGGGGQK